MSTKLYAMRFKHYNRHINWNVTCFNKKYLALLLLAKFNTFDICLWSIHYAEITMTDTTWKSQKTLRC